MRTVKTFSSAVSQTTGELDQALLRLDNDVNIFALGLSQQDPPRQIIAVTDALSRLPDDNLVVIRSVLHDFQPRKKEV